jgi:hypothetical protein
MEHEDHPTPHSEQTGDDVQTRARDLGEQPKDRDLSPGEPHEEPNPDAIAPDDDEPPTA